MKTKPLFIALATCAALLAVTVFLYISRSRPSPHAFSTILSEADALAESGEKVKAISRLEKARKRAISTVNWLSIAKREIALSDFRAAEKSLRQAIELFPANDRLAATLVYLLVRQGRLDDAEQFLPFLADTEFAPLAAYAEIALDAPDFSLGGEKGFLARPSAYKEAWRVTGNHVFRRNAAVLYSLAGDYRAALSTFAIPAESSMPKKNYDALQDDRLFHAIVAYDARAFSTVFEVLGSGSLESLSAEEALLAADAYFLAGNINSAALIWRSFFQSAHSPLIFFNAAIAAPIWAEKREALEKCLELFPAYYPALAVYARSSLEADSTENYFPFYGDSFSARALGETLHVSQGMEEAYRNRSISLVDAQKALDAALAVSLKDDAFRLQIELERVRFLCFKAGKDAEARHVLWNILEQYSSEDLAAEFALWFFAEQSDFDVFFELAGKFESANPVYLGIISAAEGRLDAALECFNSAVETIDEWAALANTAVVFEKQDAYSNAADYFALAADLAVDNQVKSRLYYRAAQSFSFQKAYRRAADILRHAVSLDSGNYSARAMLRRFELEQGF